MKLTQEEIKWLERIKNNPDNYIVEVDNDSVDVSEKVINPNSIDESDYEWRNVYTFDGYGQDFIVKLLNTFGIS